MCDSSPKKGFKQVKTKTKNKKIKIKKELEITTHDRSIYPFARSCWYCPWRSPQLQLKQKLKPSPLVPTQNQVADGEIKP